MKNIVWSIFFVVIFALLALNVSAAMQVVVMPGSAVRGERILEDKACLGCHALNGKGGNRAPDLARSSRQSDSPALFASRMWNHSPGMWAEFQATGRSVPDLSSSETADLFAYFYATLYFSRSGDANRGKALFQEKRCVACHSEVLNPKLLTSKAEGWLDLQDPIEWAERMWNHAGEMDAAMSNRGISWRNLSEQDVVDLLLFLSRLPDVKLETAVFNVGEPERGMSVFNQSCGTCHSFGQPGKSHIDLLAKSSPTSITGFIAAMWNHVPEMRRRSGSGTPKLAAGDMPDLIAYLFSQRYFIERGNPTRGRRVFESKGCVTCHESRRTEMAAPDLSRAAEVYSPITLTAAVWRHGPSMLEKMKQQRLSWPEFQGAEMGDLIAYLNSRLTVLVAR